MPRPTIDWAAAYVVPAALRFRLTPSGAFQVDGDASAASVEVAAGALGLFLAYARPQTPDQAFAQAAQRGKLDRETYRRLLELWLAQGLLQTSAEEPLAAASPRLALFRKTLAHQGAADAARGGSAARFAPQPISLRSPFELQRPLMYYPGLTTGEVHDHRRFPWVAALEQSFAAIRGELDVLLSSPSFAPVHPAHTSKGEWKAAYFWAYGQQVPATCDSCPVTARLLATVPGVERFGTSLFSALSPKSQIAPHFGFTNAKLRCQLPLRVPPGCGLKVGEREVEQREGRCIVFDDSFLHSAWNDSDQPRFVLVFDFFHPDLTEEEISYLGSLADEQRLGDAYLDQVAAAEPPANSSR